MLSLLIVATIALGFVLNLSRSRRLLTPDKIHLSVAIGYNIQWMSRFQKQCAKFNAANPDVQARVVGIPGRYYDQVLVRMAGGTVPDIMWMGKDFPRFASRGAFLDVDDAFDFDPSEYYTIVVDQYRYGGRLQGAPYCGDFGVLVYNKDIFKAEGIDYPADDWTIWDFRRIARDLTQRNDDGRLLRWGVRGDVDSGAFGAFPLSADKTESTLDDPRWIAYYDFVLAMRHEDKSTPGEMAQQYGSDTTPQQSFLAGKTAMFVTNVYTLPELRERTQDIDWDIVQMPRGERSSTVASTQGFAIYAKTKHPAEAVRLLAHLVAPAAQYEMRDLGVPTHRATARRAIENMPAPPANGQAQLVSMDFVNPFPRVRRINELEVAFVEAQNQILTGRKTPAKAMLECHRRFQDILARK
jgi:multiple sugar transport system substrate-binding protein